MRDGKSLNKSNRSDGGKFQFFPFVSSVNMYPSEYFSKVRGFLVEVWLKVWTCVCDYLVLVGLVTRPDNKLHMELCIPSN